MISRVRHPGQPPRDVDHGPGSALGRGMDNRGLAGMRVQHAEARPPTADERRNVALQHVRDRAR